MLKLDKIINLLQQTNTYRDFINSYFEELAKADANYSLTTWLKKSGVSSKSLLLDIKSGRRRISPKNISIIKSILQLPIQAEAAFEYKVAMEENDLFPTKTSQQIAGLFEQALNFLLGQSIHHMQHLEIFQSVHWPVVFAALGDENGSTVAEIAGRCSLSRLEIREILHHFIFHGYVKVEGERYVVQQNAIENYMLSQNKSFQSYFVNANQKIQSLAQKKFSDQNNIFIAASVSVNRTEIAHFRAKLQTLLSEFAHQAEQSKGDRVATFAFGLYLE